MPEEQSEKLGFREWTTHYEKEQEADRDRINEVAKMVGVLGGQVGRLTANMETWIDTQKTMSHRINRPWQWGVVVSIFMGMFAMSAMFATMATLIVSPMNNTIATIQDTHSRDVERNLSLHMWFRETISEIQVSDAAAETDMKWMMKMEERVNGRIHARILGENP
jgi:hypothetical protein